MAVQRQERRLNPRKTLQRLTYIELPSGNGGIVTDVSEGGLGFHAVSPVEAFGPVQFSLAGGSKRIAGVGDLVWTDAMKKSGGLRFTEIPEEIRAQIRNWPFESNLRLWGDAREDFAEYVEAANAQAEAISADSTRSRYFPELSSPEAAQPKRSFLIKAIGASSLAGVIGVLSYLCYREAREWMTDSRKSATGEQAAPALTPTEASAPSPDIALLKNAADTSGPETAEVPTAGAAQSASQEVNEAEAPELPVAGVHHPRAAETDIYFVQVAAVTEEAAAYKLLHSLQQQHFAAFISPPVSDAFYRVQLGPYQTGEAARVALKELQKAGYKPFIRH